MPCHLRSTQKSKYRVQSTALIGNILFARTKNFSLVRTYAYSSLDVLASEFTTFAWLGLRQFSPFKKYTLQYSSNETRPLCTFIVQKLIQNISAPMRITRKGRDSVVEWVTLYGFQTVSEFVKFENSFDNARFLWRNFNKPLLDSLVIISDSSEKSQFD